MNRLLLRLIILLLCTLPAGVFAQYKLVLKDPGPLGVMIDELLNPTIINSSGYSSTVYLKYIVWDNTNEEMVQYSSNIFTLNTGVTVFNWHSVGLGEEDYSDMNFETCIKKSGYFPFGKFRYCVSLIKYEEEKELAKECKYSVALPMQPLHLVYPRDNSILYTKLPCFTWVPLQTLNLFQDQITYQFILKEKLSGQTSWEALNTNGSLHEAEDLKYPFHLYPATSQTLSPGQEYVWQVKAKVGNLEISESEIWTFKLSQDSFPPKDSTSLNFISLKKVIDGDYYTVSDQLKFNFDGVYNTRKLTAKILDEKQVEIKSAPFQQLVQKYGDNAFFIEMSDIQGLSANNMYMLEVKNEKGEQYYLRFKYQPTY